MLIADLAAPNSVLGLTITEFWAVGGGSGSTGPTGSGGRWPDQVLGWTVNELTGRSLFLVGLNAVDLAAWGTTGTAGGFNPAWAQGSILVGWGGYV